MNYIDEAKALELLKAGADITNWHETSEIMVMESDLGNYYQIRKRTFDSLLKKGLLKQVSEGILKADCYIYKPQP